MVERWIKNPVKYLNEEGHPEAVAIAKSMNYIIDSILKLDTAFSPEVRNRYKSIQEILRTKFPPFLPELLEDLEIEMLEQNKGSVPRHF